MPAVEPRFSFRGGVKSGGTISVSSVRTGATLPVAVGAATGAAIGPAGTPACSPPARPAITTTAANARATMPRAPKASGFALRVRMRPPSRSVEGTITPQAQAQELRWYAVGGWSVPVMRAQVTVSGPAAPRNLSCFAGPLTSAMPCTEAFMDHTGAVAEFGQQGLGPGEVLTVIVGYPAAATSGAPIVARRFELSNAFTLNAVTGGALAGLLFLLLGGVALLYWARGRDARVVGHESGPLSGVENGHFTPPDGVRPGQIGTLVDEQADVIDVTATIVDLAVRGFLRIDELPRQTYQTPDWRLVRLPAAQITSLMAYELELYDAVFDGRDEVLLSELPGIVRRQARQGPRGALPRRGQAGLVRPPPRHRTHPLDDPRCGPHRARRPGHPRAGLVHHLWPARPGADHRRCRPVRGRPVHARQDRRRRGGPRPHPGIPGVPDRRRHRRRHPRDQRIELFSRYLPYAVIFDSVDRWARVVSSVTGDGRQVDNLYWYHGPAEWDLSRFADSMRTFTMTTSGAISATRQFRSL